MNNQLEERKQQYNQNEEIDLLDLVRTIVDHKKVILVTMITCMIIALVGGKIYNNSKKYSSVVINLNYPEASQGLNPNGTVFTKNELLPKDVINAVYSQYREEIKFKTSEEFNQSIKITGIIPDIIKTSIKEKEKKGEKYLYNPTEYLLETKNKPEILNSVVTAMIADFKDEYKPNTVIMPLAELNDYDYMDAYNIINNKVDSLRKITEENSRNVLISNKLGYSFDSVMLELKNIQDIDLKAFYSYILVNGFTINGDIAIVKYDSEIKELQLQKETLEGKAQVIKKMLVDYKPQEKTFVLPNGGETNGKIDFTNDYYSGLINEYLDINNQIMNVTGHIKRIKELKSLIKIPSNDEKLKMQKSINAMIKKVNETIEELNTINKEYYEIRYSDMITISSPVITTTTGKPLYMYLVVGLVLGGCFGIFLAFASEFKKDYKKRYSK